MTSSQELSYARVSIFWEAIPNEKLKGDFFPKWVFTENVLFENFSKKDILQNYYLKNDCSKRKQWLYLGKNCGEKTHFERRLPLGELLKKICTILSMDLFWRGFPLGVSFDESVRILISQTYHLVIPQIKKGKIMIEWKRHNFLFR